jgi:hypothetical protein
MTAPSLETTLRLSAEFEAFVRLWNFNSDVAVEKRNDAAKEMANKLVSALRL